MNILSINPQFLLSMPGGGEWIIILIAVIVLFGGKKLPELARGLGKGMREFKEAKEGMDEQIKKGANEANEPVPTMQDIKK